VIVHADVRTMDAAHPHATAIAITGSTITYVGDDASALIGPHTDVRDLGGRSVTPGLVDAHCHVYGLGLDLESIDLRGKTSEQAAAAAVIEGAKHVPAGEWVLGRGWDQNRWPGHSFPSHDSIDAIDRPVVLTRIDGHAIWVNSAALKAAGITNNTTNAEGGKIIRKLSSPTGVFVDNAMGLINSVMPVPSAEVRERRLRAGLSKLPAVGLTGIHDMGLPRETIAVLEKLAAAGQLPVHVYSYLLGDAAHPPEDSPKPAIGRFEMRGVKFYADGALGSRGARLYADYDDDPGNRGLWVTEPATLAHGVEGAVAHGWQVATHAIGDAAVGAVLDAYLAAEKAHPGDLRLRVEHVQIIAPQDEPKLVAAHAIASMQPTHATSDMPWAEARIGKVRIQGAYAWRKMLALGVPIAAGSDFPVERISPLLGLYAAVTRQDTDGNPPGGWYPDQRMSLDEAIAAFTRGAAYASFAEDHRGMIAVGFEADLTAYDRALSPTNLRDLAADLTIVDGKIAYDRHHDGPPIQNDGGGTD
jgi:hypothetical protein